LEEAVADALEDVPPTYDELVEEAEPEATPPEVEDAAHETPDEPTVQQLSLF
jgi:hypothetical protein